MAKRRRRLISAIIVLAWIIPTILLSQNSDLLLNISFRLLSVGEANWNDIYYIKKPASSPDGRPELQKLLFNYLDRSVDFYDYQGNDPLVFYRIKNEDDPATLELKPIASVHISTDITKPLLFFSKSGVHFKNATLSNADISDSKFDIIAIEDNATAFPKGHVIFLNTVGVPLYSLFGDDKIKFPPGITKPIPIAKYFNKEIFVGMVIKKNDSAKVVLKNHWRFLPDYRYIMLIKPPKQKGSWRIRVLQITEYVKENREFNPDYNDPEDTDSDL